MPSSNWTYNQIPKSTESRALVRLYIGDTDQKQQLLTDGEIDMILGIQTNVVLAAAACADAIAAKFSRRVDKDIGETSISLSDQRKAYQDLADRLRELGGDLIPGGSGGRVATAFAGGLSYSGVDAIISDEDFKQPSFELGQDDYPGTTKNTQNRNDEWE
jgi:hypothetical protein